MQPAPDANVVTMPQDFLAEAARRLAARAQVHAAEPSGNLLDADGWYHEAAVTSPGHE